MTVKPEEIAGLRRRYLWMAVSICVLDIGISPGLRNDVEHRQSWYLNNRASLPGLAVPPAFAPSRDSGRLAPPGMIAAGCGSKVDEMRGLRRSGDFRAA